MKGGSLTKIKLSSFGNFRLTKWKASAASADGQKTFIRADLISSLGRSLNECLFGEGCK